MLFLCVLCVLLLQHESKRLGLLVNFNTLILHCGIHRVINAST